LNEEKAPIASRFRGYLPVVVDVETGGFNSQTDALLECAAVIITMNDGGILEPGEKFFYNIDPFEGANIEQASLEFTGIDPTNPLRMAVPEMKAMSHIFKAIRAEIRQAGCTRAVMVAHNASFDHGFVNAAAERCNIKRNPFHPFSSFDTATLCGLAFGQTVLARACAVAGIDFNPDEAHSAEYDCDKTADIFCHIVNKWNHLGGYNFKS
jgi:ribonuclease T